MARKPGVFWAEPGRGVTVVRVEQPWRVAGRKVAGPPATLDRAWLAVLAALDVTGPLVVGGRSAGARVAYRTEVQVGAVGYLSPYAMVSVPGADHSFRVGKGQDRDDTLAGLANSVGEWLLAL